MKINMYTDFLPRIKNAQRAKKEITLAPFSKADFSIAKILVENNYLKDAQKKTIGKKNFLEIKLFYKDGRPPMENFKFISKPSRHIYSDYRSLRPVKSGYGLGIISTSQGIMTIQEAKKKKVGGEYLFQIW